MTQREVTRVLLLFKTHLDVGFTDLARNVKRRYFREFIPNAVRLGSRLRESGASERFVWTTGSWILYEYLEQASVRERRELECAIRAGAIAWHGLPFTTHSELMDDSLFRFGLSLSQELDRRYGKRTVAAKMTDVPGHTRGIVPLLAQAGIRLLHIGVNCASTPPEVPALFRWRAAEGAEIVVMYDKDGYGKTTVFPEAGLAVCFDHSGDNHGPPTLEGVVNAHAKLRAEFPRATIEAATLNDVATALQPCFDALPVVTQELGDTWIHGVGTDPGKVAAFRALSRLRRAWLQRRLSARDAGRVAAFSRALLCIPEHTWGLDLKTALNDFTHYARPAHARLRRTARCRRFESSWREQRQYLHLGIRELGASPMAKEARALLRSLKPRAPGQAGMTPMERPDALLDAGAWRVAFCPASGAITRLVDAGTGRDWAGGARRLGGIRYEIFGQADYDRFRRQYVRLNDTNRWWAIPDFTKPGLPEELRHAVWEPHQTRFWTDDNKGCRRVLAEVAMPEEPVRRFGCPRRFTCEYLFPAAGRAVEIRLQWFEKSACRMPEAIWFSFVPRVARPDAWVLNKLGEWISPLDVAVGGNRRLHAVQEEVACDAPDGRVVIRSTEAALAAPGKPELLNFHGRQPDLNRGMHFNLYNNLWGTNFPMWYERDARFCFSLEFP